jgi:hypothetical protein
MPGERYAAQIVLHQGVIAPNGHTKLQLIISSDRMFGFRRDPNELPKDRGLIKLVTTSLFLLLAALPVNAQQTTGGRRGSPRLVGLRAQSGQAHHCL